MALPVEDASFWETSMIVVAMAMDSSRSTPDNWAVVANCLKASAISPALVAADISTFVSLSTMVVASLASSLKPFNMEVR